LHNHLVKNVLVFRIGSLGDTLVAVPALWVLREHFPEARFTLLCDRQSRKLVLAADVLDCSGLIDDFLTYPFRGSKLTRFLDGARLWWRLRSRHFDALVYLAPSQRNRRQVRRDRLFFKTLGVKRLIGMEFGNPYQPKKPGCPLPESPREADLLLARLASSGIPIPAPGEGKATVGPGDDTELDNVLAGLPSDERRPWIALCLGGKVPANKWPRERYVEVAQRLIDKFGVWPVVLGGPEDRESGEAVVGSCRTGYNLAGRLSLQGSLAALHRCRLYLGNDTGTMHMAAAASVPCVGVFSSRNPPGLWHPYGAGHRVLRTPIDCEGCGLVTCVERKMECIHRIGADEVFRECDQLLSQSLQNPIGSKEHVDGA
jgi:heptosyltransferase III